MSRQLDLLALPIQRVAPVPDPFATVRATRLALHLSRARQRAIAGREHPDKAALHAAVETDLRAHHAAESALTDEQLAAWRDEPAVCEGGRCGHLRVAERELGT